MGAHEPDCCTDTGGTALSAERAAMTDRIAWLVGLLAIVIMGLVVLFWPLKVKAQDGHRHPAQDIEAHRSFYWYLTRPDIPNAVRGSCCSDGDCYQTPARLINGVWWALRREDQQWIEVPAWRVVTREDELARRTDNRATLCATAHFLYCFVPPETEM